MTTYCTIRFESLTFQFSSSTPQLHLSTLLFLMPEARPHHLRHGRHRTVVPRPSPRKREYRAPSSHPRHSSPYHRSRPRFSDSPRAQPNLSSSDSLSKPAQVLPSLRQSLHSTYNYNHQHENHRQVPSHASTLPQLQLQSIILASVRNKVRELFLIAQAPPQSLNFSSEYLETKHVEWILYMHHLCERCPDTALFRHIFRKCLYKVQTLPSSNAVSWVELWDELAREPHRRRPRAEEKQLRANQVEELGLTYQTLGQFQLLRSDDDITRFYSRLFFIQRQQLVLDMATLDCIGASSAQVSKANLTESREKIVAFRPEVQIVGHCDAAVDRTPVRKSHLDQTERNILMNDRLLSKSVCSLSMTQTHRI